ncbi:MAG: hypothetical protein FJ137_00165 [Deltaproteobacteria bacterium]|nr:hypothetical protein [Deltaproteobacteria bacterium]
MARESSRAARAPPCPPRHRGAAVLLSCCPAVLLSCCPAVLLSCCPAVLRGRRKAAERARHSSVSLAGAAQASCSPRRTVTARCWSRSPPSRSGMTTSTWSARMCAVPRAAA